MHSISHLLTDAALEKPRTITLDERVTFRANGDQLTKLETVCARHGISSACFLRTAIDKLVSEYEPE